MRFRWLWAWIALLLPLSGCVREYGEPAGPKIRVISPQNPPEVVTNDGVALALDVSSFTGVTSVTVNGQAMAYNTTLRQYEANLGLSEGLNSLIVSAKDPYGVASQDTVWMMRMAPQRLGGGPALPQPRGGLAATYLPTQKGTLVTGGAASLQSPASNEAYWLADDAAEFRTLPKRMNVARTGHTATPLLDGRVLILGGSKVENPTSVSDLVETAELFDPESGTFNVIPIKTNNPIRRTYHTAVAFDEARNVTTYLVYLFGGRGDVRYGTNPTMGTREDLRVFRFRNDSLIAVSPTFGYILKPNYGHTMTPFFSSYKPRELRFWVAGADFTNDVEGASQSFRYDIRNDNPTGILPSVRFYPDALPWIAPRIRHTGSIFHTNIVVLAGGMGRTTNDVLGDFEVVAPTFRQSFYLPASVRLGQKRFGHAATNPEVNRILFIGGFTTSGAALTSSEYWTF